LRVRSFLDADTSVGLAGVKRAFCHPSNITFIVQQLKPEDQPNPGVPPGRQREQVTPLNHARRILDA
jgi:hypothetical protein